MRNNDETIPEEIWKDIPNLPGYEAVGIFCAHTNLLCYCTLDQDTQGLTPIITQ